MCDKICFEKIRRQATKVQIDEIINSNQNLIFGNKVDLSFLKKFDVNACCKNCVHNKNLD